MRFFYLLSIFILLAKSSGESGAGDDVDDVDFEIKSDTEDSGSSTASAINTTINTPTTNGCIKDDEDTVGDEFIIVERKDFWGSTKCLFGRVIPSIARAIREEFRDNFHTIDESKQELKLFLLIMLENTSSSTKAVSKIILSIVLSIILYSLRIGKDISICATGLLLQLVNQIPPSFTPSAIIQEILDEFPSSEDRNRIASCISEVLCEIGSPPPTFSSDSTAVLLPISDGWDCCEDVVGFGVGGATKENLDDLDEDLDDFDEDSDVKTNK